MRKMKKLKSLPVFIIMIALFAGLLNGCKKDQTNKKDPVISWENPADIFYGTLLSGTQLNATADVPGTFVYTPATGTKLPEGLNQELRADFTPTDASAYNTASKTVKINVKYGGVSSAIFNPTSTYGTVTDIDGNEYKTIVIGTQTWMAENLRVVRYRNGDSIPLVTSNSAWKSLTSNGYCNYKNINNLDTIATMGRLYNWFTVSNNRNIAPAGWHVASDGDWATLTTFLGGAAVAGGKLKESGTSHWSAPNTSASNSSGFTALPGGRREYSDGTFLNLTYDGFWWTSSAYNPDYSWYYDLHYTFASIDRANFHKQYGYSVRCMKD